MSDEDSHSGYSGESSSDESDDGMQHPQTAAEFKTLGNEFYSQGEFKDAISMYSRAIEMAPDQAAYWGNRAAAYMALKDFKSALSDALKGIELQPGFTKAHLRASNCYLNMGNFNAARDMLRPVIANATAVRDMKTIDDTVAKITEAQALLDDGKLSEAQTQIMALMTQCSDAISLRVMLIECLIGKKSYDQARMICESIYSNNRNNNDIIRLRGTILYYTGSIEPAISHFQQILRRDPDNRKTATVFKKVKKLERKKKAGNEAFKRRRNEEAIKLYSEALSIDSHNDQYNAKLYGNRAAAKMRLSQWEEAKQDCDHSILCDRTYVKSYTRRSTCYNEMEMYAEALRDLEQAKKINPETPDIDKEIRAAKIEMKKANRKQYYKILGVGKRAEGKEIKKSYRKLALKWHPDKHGKSAPAVKAAAEAKWTDIQEAYECLSDPQARRRYDSGADLMQEMGMGGGFPGGMRGHPGMNPFGGMGGMGGGGFRFNFG